MRVGSERAPDGVRGGFPPPSESVVVGFCLSLPCPQVLPHPQVSPHCIKSCNRQSVLGRAVRSPRLPGGHGHSSRHGDTCSLWQEVGYFLQGLFGFISRFLSPRLGVFVSPMVPVLGAGDGRCPAPGDPLALSSAKWGTRLGTGTCIE